MKGSLCLAAALALSAVSVHAQSALKTEARTVSLSLDGSFDRYGESRSDELRAGLEFECASELKLGRSALDWNLEAYYDYARSDTDGAVTNANSAGLDLAKILLSRWKGTELEVIKPYLLAGVELTWLTEPDEEGEKVSSRFLSPTVGAGLEIKLNKRASLNAEFRQNMEGGARRIAGVTLGLTYAIFGADEEEPAKTEKAADEKKN